VIGTLLWVAWGLAFAVLEGLALLRHDDTAEPTLTHVILADVPRWLLAMALGWLAYHFLIQVGAG